MNGFRTRDFLEGLLGISYWWGYECIHNRNLRYRRHHERQHLLTSCLKTWKPQLSTPAFVFLPWKPTWLAGTSTMNEDLFPIENGEFSSQSFWYFFFGGTSNSKTVSLTMLGFVFTWWCFLRIRSRPWDSSPLRSTTIWDFLFFFQAPKEANLRRDWLLTGLTPSHGGGWTANLSYGSRWTTQLPNKCQVGAMFSKYHHRRNTPKLTC